MQLVVVELCASRIDLLPAAASPFAADAPIINAARRTSRPRTFPSSIARVRGQHNALRAAAICAKPRTLRRVRCNWDRGVFDSGDAIAGFRRTLRYAVRI